MTERVTIPIAEQRYDTALPYVPESPQAPSGRLIDSRRRPLHDLRISVTDRCNFRCSYCMPKSVFDRDYAFLPQSSLLRFEEIERIVKVFVSHGVEKVRLTGGEPLLRKNLEKLIERLARLTTVKGQALDLTLTTNGSLLTRKAALLRDAGLQRITVSLDSMDDAVFKAMNDVDFPVAKVIEGIDAAAAAGFGRVVRVARGAKHRVESLRACAKLRRVCFAKCNCARSAHALHQQCVRHGHMRGVDGRPVCGAHASRVLQVFVGNGQAVQRRQAARRMRCACKQCIGSVGGCQRLCGCQRHNRI